MTQEEKDRWECKIRSCQTMVLEGSTHPDFSLYLAVDAELTRLRELVKGLEESEEMLFVRHIEGHLQDDQEVMCKICNKTITEIWEVRYDTR